LLHWYIKKHKLLRNHTAELKSLRDVSSKVSIGEDGRAGEALELAILSVSSTCSSLIPEKNAFSASHAQKMASVSPQIILKGSYIAFLRKIFFL
jgi:hypothetical protein